MSVFTQRLGIKHPVRFVRRIRNQLLSDTHRENGSALQRGNRHLNFAIHIAAVVQIRTGGEGRVFYDRKIAEGKSNKEAIRSLKRRISDRVYSHLVADAKRAAAN